MARAAVRCRNACDKAQDEPAVRYWMGYLDALEEIQSDQSDENIAAELERTADQLERQLS